MTLTLTLDLWFPNSNHFIVELTTNFLFCETSILSAGNWNNTSQRAETAAAEDNCLSLQLFCTSTNFEVRSATYCTGVRSAGVHFCGRHTAVTSKRVSACKHQTVSNHIPCKQLTRNPQPDRTTCACDGSACRLRRGHTPELKWAACLWHRRHFTLHWVKSQKRHHHTGSFSCQAVLFFPEGKNVVNKRRTVLHLQILCSVQPLAFENIEWKEKERCPGWRRREHRDVFTFFPWSCTQSPDSIFKGRDGRPAVLLCLKRRQLTAFTILKGPS